jgi:hypothetical protein
VCKAGRWRTLKVAQVDPSEIKMIPHEEIVNDYGWKKINKKNGVVN